MNAQSLLRGQAQEAGCPGQSQGKTFLGAQEPKTLRNPQQAIPENRVSALLREQSHRGTQAHESFALRLMKAPLDKVPEALRGESPASALSSSTGSNRSHACPLS